MADIADGAEVFFGSLAIGSPQFRWLLHFSLYSTDFNVQTYFGYFE
jgi:hypothetical protein